jgi:hypothetical protein
MAYMHEIYRNKVFSTVAVQAQRRFAGRHLLAVQYAYRKANPLNIGFRAVFELRPFQLYIGSDNVIGIFQPLQSSATNLRFGINIVIPHQTNKNNA